MCWNLCSNALLYPVSCLSPRQLGPKQWLTYGEHPLLHVIGVCWLCLCLSTIAFDCSEAVQVGLYIFKFVASFFGTIVQN